MIFLATKQNKTISEGGGVDDGTQQKKTAEENTKKENPSTALPPQPKNDKIQYCHFIKLHKRSTYGKHTQTK